MTRQSKHLGMFSFMLGALASCISGSMSKDPSEGMGGRSPGEEQGQGGRGGSGTDATGGAKGGAAGSTMFDAGATAKLDAAVSPDAGQTSPIDALVPLSTLPGVVLWLDASNGVVTTTEGISMWTDLSGQHNDATQTNAALRPMLATKGSNGHPTIRFDRARRTALSIKDSPSMQWGTGAFTVVLVAANRTPVLKLCHGGGVATVFAKPHPQGGSTEIAFHFNFFTGEKPGQCIDDASTLHFGFGESSPGLLTEQSGFNDGVTRVFTATLSEVGSKRVYEIRVNGASLAKSAAFDATDLSLPGMAVSIGAAYGQALEGDIAEVVAIKGSASPAVLAQVESQLMSKYAIRP